MRKRLLGASCLAVILIGGLSLHHTFHKMKVLHWYADFTDPQSAGDSLDEDNTAPRTSDSIVTDSTCTIGEKIICNDAAVFVDGGGNTYKAAE